MGDHLVDANKMMEATWPQHDCPLCGADCAITFGNLWDHDFAFCPCCGWEGYLDTSTCVEDVPEAYFGNTGQPPGKP